MNKGFQYGIIHVHTEMSTKDSTVSPTQLCQKAAELKCPAVVLTDHGVLTGVFEFMKAAKEYGIKGIPGVEAYVREDNSVSRAAHLVLIPKNYDGYKAISKAVTLSNTRIINDVPCMDSKILNDCFGAKSTGHGNVIALSACAGGILSQILLRSVKLEQERNKIQERVAKKGYQNPKEPSYLKNLELIENLDAQIKKLMDERDKAKKISEKKYLMKEKALSAMPEGSAEYLKHKAILEAEKKESLLAAENYEKLKEKILKLQNHRKSVKLQCSKAERTHAQYNQAQEKLNAIQKSIQPNSLLFEEAVSTAKEYNNIFGKDNFFIELQYHRIPDEKFVMPKLAKIAQLLSLPVVACNDVHFLENTKDAIRARRIVNSLRYNHYVGEQAGDSEYYIKTDAELSNILSEILPKDIVEQAMKGIGLIINSCNVVFPKETHFPVFISDDGEDAKSRLRRLAQDGIADRYPNDAWTKELEKRLEYELNVIEEQGYSDYLCIVQDFLEYARKRGRSNPEKVGLSVGPGRGSAVGSLVCYLSGITSVDPIRYKLIFERFLSRERVTMPDIDSDFDTNIRGEDLEYVKNKYGKNSVINIATKGTLAARNAIRSAGRIYGDEKYHDPKSLLGLSDAIAKCIPKNKHLADVEEDLLKKFKGNANALQIVHDAKLIEDVVCQYGMHAAGVIISDNDDVSEYIPLMWNKTNECMVCQCDKEEAELNAGLLKMDFLGLRNLNIISDTLRMIYRRYGIRLDIEKVGKSLIDERTTPYDRTGNVFDDIFSKGRTNSVFQFESQGMISMLKQFRPTNLNDIILLVAAYRPGPMQYLKQIMEVKHGKTKPKYIIPEMENILGDTYGCVIYQEQVMQIFNQFAGFSLGEADIIRRYMAKKETDKFALYKEKFIDGLVEKGAKRKDAENFWEEILKFSEYAFNKSHACAYALVSFYTAWLKLNYPVEYMTAVFNYSPQEKYPMLITECKKLGISVLPPDINHSDAEFKCVDNDILFGLGNIKGYKSGCMQIIQERNISRFVSLKDFIKRINPNKSSLEVLVDSGALDCWCKNRKAIKIAATDLKELYESVEKTEKQFYSEKDMLASTLATAGIILDKTTDLEMLIKQKVLKKKDTMQYLRLLKKMAALKKKSEEIIIPISYPENRKDRLQKEKDLLGMYVTGHPLDDYSGSLESRSFSICDIQEGKAAICGIIENVRRRYVKKNGKEIAFFDIVDETGSIEVCCFSKSHEENREQIFEGNVVLVEGECRNEDTVSGEDTVYKFFCDAVIPLKRTKPKVLFSVPNIVYWTEIAYYQISTRFKGDDYELLIHDKNLGEIRTTKNLTVSADILNADIPSVEVSLYQV